jgi:hypothetical protein
MNNTLTKTSVKLTRKERNIIIAATVAMAIAAVLLALNVPFAAASWSSGMSSILKSVIDTLGKIGLAVGAVVLLWGVLQLIMAFLQQNPDSKTSASTTIAVALILINAKSILESLHVEKLFKV